MNHMQDILHGQHPQGPALGRGESDVACPPPSTLTVRYKQSVSGVRLPSFVTVLMCHDSPHCPCQCLKLSNAECVRAEINETVRDLIVALSWHAVRRRLVLIWSGVRACACKQI